MSIDLDNPRPGSEDYHTLLVSALEQRDDALRAIKALRRELFDAEDENKTLKKRLSVSHPPITGATSDGYHTFDDLYEHRMTLFLALCEQVDCRTPTGHVWRSKLHSDGTEPFGGGWFVMGIGTVPGEQITYHLPLSRWGETDWLGTENERAPEFDGHTSDDVLVRLRRFYQ